MHFMFAFLVPILLCDLQHSGDSCTVDAVHISRLLDKPLTQYNYYLQSCLPQPMGVT